MLLEQTWRSASELEYVFQVHDSDATLPMWGGIYMFCSEQGSGWKVQYIGETDEFSETITSQHEAWVYARQMGATHVHLMLDSRSRRRKRVKNDLVATLRPICNSGLNIESSPARRSPKQYGGIAYALA